jgi:putative membrane protein
MMRMLSWPGALFAQTEVVTTDSPAWNWSVFGWHLLNVVIYVVIGLALFAIAYLIVDKATPFSLGQELIEKKNTAMAILLAGVFIGIAIILAAAIRG